MPSNQLLAATPPMGWNSWNMFGSKVNEDAVRATADTLVSSGMKELGYNYVVIDDCWSVKAGRDGNDDLVPDPERFPSGMRALGDYVHSLGLKFGMYSDAAERTCAGYPASYGHEEQDAALFASYGVDFLKYDYCNAPEDQASAIDRYTRMGKALKGCGREILFSLCEWGNRSPHLWGPQVGGSMWRVSGDIFDSWVNVWNAQGSWYGLGIDTSFGIASTVAEYGGPGGWNDLDMLIVGLKGKGHIAGVGLSNIEYATHMTLWVIACSPLMIGCDIRNMDEHATKLLTNPEVLAINQDPLGIPGRRARKRGPHEVWRKPLSDGSIAVAIFNRDSTGADITVKSSDIGLLDTPKVAQDLWLRKEVGEFTDKLILRVQPHESILLKVRG